MHVSVSLDLNALIRDDEHFLTTLPSIVERFSTDLLTGLVHGTV